MRILGSFLACSILLGSGGLADAGGRTGQTRPAVRAASRVSKPAAAARAKPRLAAARRATTRREEFPFGTELGAFERITFASLTNLLGSFEAGTLEATMDNPQPIETRRVDLKPLARAYQARTKRATESSAEFFASLSALEAELFGPLGLDARQAQDIAFGEGGGIFFQSVKASPRVTDPRFAIAQGMVEFARAYPGYGRLLGRVRKDPVALVKFMRRVHEGRFLRRGDAPTANESRLYDDVLAALRPTGGFIPNEVVHEITVAGAVERADAETALLPKARVRQATQGLFERR